MRVRGFIIVTRRTGRPSRPLPDPSPSLIGRTPRRIVRGPVGCEDADATTSRRGADRPGRRARGASRFSVSTRCVACRRRRDASGDAARRRAASGLPRSPSRRAARLSLVLLYFDVLPNRQRSIFGRSPRRDAGRGRRQDGAGDRSRTCSTSRFEAGSRASEDLQIRIAHRLASAARRRSAPRARPGEACRRFPIAGAAH